MLLPKRHLNVPNPPIKFLATNQLDFQLRLPIEKTETAQNRRTRRQGELCDREQLGLRAATVLAAIWRAEGTLYYPPKAVPVGGLLAS